MKEFDSVIDEIFSSLPDMEEFVYLNFAMFTGESFPNFLSYLKNMHPEIVYTAQDPEYEYSVEQIKEAFKYTVKENYGKRENSEINHGFLVRDGNYWLALEEYREGLVFNIVELKNLKIMETVPLLSNLFNLLKLEKEDRSKAWVSRLSARFTGLFLSFRGVTFKN